MMGMLNFSGLWGVRRFCPFSLMIWFKVDFEDIEGMMNLTLSGVCLKVCWS